ncbi:MAG TPA: toxin [Fibrobacteres bacterium]|jgi:uncharacterized protein|nr:toxin [Fibrobacterota bacterium]
MNYHFDFDVNKSKSNKQKHGIDFIKIQALWEDSDRVEIPARTEDEPRYLIIGKIKNFFWSVIITYREGKIRIISARRSREKEVEIYES